MEKDTIALTAFVHLHLHTPYSFLDGATHIEKMVCRAAELGMTALAMTDHDSVAACVKFAACCKGYGIKPVIGSEVTLEDGSHLTLLAESRTGYANLCALLTRSFFKGGRLTPSLPCSDLQAHAEGLICLTGCRKGVIPQLILQGRFEDAESQALRLLKAFGADNLYVELQDDLTPDSARLCRSLAALADRIGVPVVATNNVHYADADDYPTHDILRCISAGITRETVHPDRPFNCERYLKSQAEMSGLFAWRPDALEASGRIAERCAADVLPNKRITPPFECPNGLTPSEYLRHLAFKGAKHRHGGGELSQPVVDRLDHELGIICTMGFADYFLMTWKVVRWARSRKIRCTGRGSAADSCVAYSLMLTDVDVIKRNLPFARFLSPGKVPDIDLDFDAFRRDEVFEYIKQEYGVENVGMACTFFTYHGRGAIRDVGKALGLPADLLAVLAKGVAHFVRANGIDRAFENNPELKRHAHLKDRLALLIDFCGRIAGFPRHLGTHSSGVIVGSVPLSSIAPMVPTARGVMPAVTLDKDDSEAIGAIKLDILSLRILSALERTVEDIQRTADPHFRYDLIPEEDEATYRLIQSGKAMGAFQLESPAQMSLACTLHPRIFEDLVASVALIRPGPDGEAVKRFVGCRNGYMEVIDLHPCLKDVLEKTFGCIIYQEQVIQVAARMMGVSDDEGDKFRKALSKLEQLGTMDVAEATFIACSLRAHRDLTPERAQLLWSMIASWWGYGFTEGHGASFAITAQKSAYLSLHYPAQYFAGMMSSMPMGFYDCNSLAAEARRRGVQIRPADINRSEWICCSEDEDAGLRLGFCLVSDMRQEDVERITKAREARAFASLLDFCARVPMHCDRLENLILAGAFDQFHEHRRGILWRLEETIALGRTYCAEKHSGLQTAIDLGPIGGLDTPCAWELEDFTPFEKLKWEWRTTGVASSCHPLAHLRPRLTECKVISAHRAAKKPKGTYVRVAGLNLRPHRPPTREGRPVLYATVEDESDFIQVECSGDFLESCAPVFLTCHAVVVEGVIKRKGTGASIVVMRVAPLDIDEIAEESASMLQEREKLAKSYLHAIVDEEKELVVA